MDAEQAPFDRHFQILSLDGGGVMGIFTAALLAGIENDLGHSVLDHFDLVVGTSTGGIVAAALGIGISPRNIVSLYEQYFPSIFPGPKVVRAAMAILRSKYSPRGLEAALRSIFRESVLGDSRIPLVIPSYDIGEKSVYLFKTPHAVRLKRDWSVPMWQVAMATSAAPTFFPAFSLPGTGIRLIDGGVWANNPAVVGVVEAVSMFGQRLESIRVLSIGTTASPRARDRKLDNGGYIQWLRSPHVIDTLLTGQSMGAFAAVQHLIGKDNAYRLDPLSPPGLMRLDRASATDLIAKAAFHSRTFVPTFEAEFGEHVAQKYRPLYGPRSGGG